MYRLCYYRFAEAAERATGRRGYDRVRNADIGLMDFKCALSVYLTWPHATSAKHSVPAQQNAHQRTSINTDPSFTRFTCCKA